MDRRLETDTRSYLIGVLWIYKIVQEFLLQRKEFIMREVLLVVVGARDKSLGMCLDI